MPLLSPAAFLFPLFPFISFFVFFFFLLYFFYFFYFFVARSLVCWFAHVPPPHQLRSVSHGQITAFAMCISVLWLVTAELVSLRGDVGTDTACAGCIIAGWKDHLNVNVHIYTHGSSPGCWGRNCPKFNGKACTTCASAQPEDTSVVARSSYVEGW